MQESKQFKVGDRVAYVGFEVFSKETEELAGTIVEVDTSDDDDRPYLINFDTEIFRVEDKMISGHSGNGKCKDGHGWWVHSEEIKSLEEKQEAKEPQVFKVGDRVEYCVDRIYLPKGSKGTVLIVGSDGSIGVEWDDFDGGHDFCGIVDGCKDGHGWWVDAADISLISCTGKSLKAYVPECSSNPHYETSVQPIEFMQANMTHEEFIGFLKGNIIKYTARCGKKDDVEKEAAKIIEYTKWLAKAYKGETIDPRES